MTPQIGIVPPAGDAAVEQTIAGFLSATTPEAFKAQVYRARAAEWLSAARWFRREGEALGERGGTRRKRAREAYRWALFWLRES